MYIGTYYPHTYIYLSGPAISLCPEEPASELAPEGDAMWATAVYQLPAVSSTGFSNKILDTEREGERKERLTFHNCKFSSQSMSRGFLSFLRFDSIYGLSFIAKKLWDGQEEKLLKK